MKIHLTAHSITIGPLTHYYSLMPPFTCLYVCFLYLPSRLHDIGYLSRALYPLLFHLLYCLCSYSLYDLTFLCGSLSAWTLASISGIVGGVFGHFGFKVSIDWRKLSLVQALEASIFCTTSGIKALWCFSG